MTLLRRLAVGAALGVLVITTSPSQPVAEAAGSGPAWKNDTVYVENHAPSYWPVWSAAEKMDNGSPLNFKVVRKCPSDSQCVRVYGRGSISGDVVGRATRWQVGNEIVDSKIILDNGWGRNVGYRLRKNVVMHELGHSVGLGHSRSRKSIMFPRANKKTSLSAADKRRLNNRY